MRFLVKKLKFSKRDRNFSAFTIIEMLVVLFIISILLLLFVPNLSQQKDEAQKGSEAAIVKTVATQIELYELNYDKKATGEDLIEKNYVTKEQWEIYERHAEENSPKEPMP